MERIVKMTEAEYERFCEFRGTEKTVRSMRAQMDMQRMRIDGSQIIVLDHEKAAQALRLAAEMQR